MVVQDCAWVWPTLAGGDCDGGEYHHCDIDPDEYDDTLKNHPAPCKCKCGCELWKIDG
jgi:hypothetical protein